MQVLLNTRGNTGICIPVQVKCDQYWPTRGSESYGFVQVTFVDVVELATYTIRTFQLVMVRQDAVRFKRCTFQLTMPRKYWVLVLGRRHHWRLPFCHPLTNPFSNPGPTNVIHAVCAPLLTIVMERTTWSK